MAIVQTAVMNFRMQVSVQILVFSRYTPMSGIAGSYGSFIATWMDLEIIIPREVNQPEKDTYHTTNMECKKNYTNKLIFKKNNGFTDLENIFMVT